jgi:hypothetical protein
MVIFTYRGGKEFPQFSLTTGFTWNRYVYILKHIRVLQEMTTSFSMSSSFYKYYQIRCIYKDLGTFLLVYDQKRQRVNFEYTSRKKKLVNS